ncbi:MAG: glycosyltransferase [Halioglobus sp.]
MKIVHFNTFEGGGGAAKASLALHRAMLLQKTDSKLVVHRRTSSDESVIGRSPSRLGLRNKRLIPWLLSAVHRVLWRPLETWTFGVFGDRTIPHHRVVEEADIIALSWVGWFLDVDSIQTLLAYDKPVVWTCYDMWAFTGGCHYSGDCDQYAAKCEQCPQMGNALAQKIPQQIWANKKDHWDTSRLTVVCPSDWLAEKVRQSGLLGGRRVEVIPTGIDTTVYRPSSRQVARNSLGLPQDKPLVLFIATRGFANERKGGPLLQESLHFLHSIQQDKLPDIVVLGRRQSTSDLHSKFKIHSLEFDDDESLALLYSACDVLVAPSKADTLPLTVLQAMACGTPCVAYDAGGMADAIEHTRNGYLANAFDTEQFARGINFILTDSARHESLAAQSVARIKSGFTAEIEAKRYLELYTELLR